MQAYPIRIQIFAQHLVNEALDIFTNVPIVTARRNASQKMLQVVSNRLVQMPAQRSVSDAIEDLQQANLLHFPVNNVRNYFRTGENE